MKQIDKKDMPKLIGLIAVAVLLFGFAAFRFFADDTPPVAAAKPKTADKVASATGAAAAPSTGGVPGTAGGAAAVTAATFDLSKLGAPVGGKDPFVQQSVAGAATATAAPVAPPPAPTQIPAPAKPEAPIASSLPAPLLKAMGLKPGQVMQETGPSLEGMEGKSAPGFPGAGPAVPVAPVAPPPPPPPAYSVTGVVLADKDDSETRSVAILRGAGVSKSGAPDRRFVSVGDPVGNGFVVAAVHADGVEIKSGSRRVTLKIGDGNNVRAN